jgi:hypothetical protein
MRSLWVKGSLLIKDHLAPSELGVEVQKAPLAGGFLGGAEGIRTPDLLNAIEARSQLRHGPRQRLWYRGRAFLSTGPEADEEGQGGEDRPQDDREAVKPTGDAPGGE